MTVGFLGAAQIDRFANINSTVIGPYERPTVRLPGAGGAPEIAGCCREVFVIVPHSLRAFVPQVEFITSVGYGTGGDHRRRLGLATAGPTLVVTDYCCLRPQPPTNELMVTSLYAGVTRDDITQRTGWPVRFAETVMQTPPPTTEELGVLRDLMNRSAPAGGRAQ